MESSVRKALSDKILADLSSQGVQKTRAQLQKVRPQILVLENLKFINDTIKELVERNHIENVSFIELTDENLRQARDIAKPHQAKYIKENKIYTEGADNIENTPAGRFLQLNKPHLYNKVLSGEMYIVRSFKVMADIKKDIITKFVKTTADQLKIIISKIDRGHGAGDGLAVSAVASARALGRVDEALGDDKKALKDFEREFEKYMENAFDTGEISADVREGIKKVTIDYKQVVTKDGKVDGEYIPIVEFQDKYTNRITDKARETQVKKTIENFFKGIDAGEIAALEGSSPIRDKMFAAAISNLIDIDVKGRKVKVTLDKRIDPRKIKLSTRGRAESKGRGGKAKGKVAIKKAAGAAAIPRGRRTPGTQNTVNIKTLLGIMNSRINDVVAKNMGPPRLENRTGTFAGSVRVTDVTETRQGHPSIGYTYRKDPYQVFEASSGTRFSSSARDPRPLIDASIREIAAQFAIGRLYTRRI